jgi:hypothetical protein
MVSKIRCFLDCEWDSQGQVICIQVLISAFAETTLVSKQYYIIFHTKYKDFMASIGYCEGLLPRFGAWLSFSPFGDDLDVLSSLIQQHCEKYFDQGSSGRVDCDLFLFYSPKDIWLSIGFDIFSHLIVTPRLSGRRQLEQKRNLSGRFILSTPSGFQVTYTVKDLCGWSNSGLQKLAASLGIDTRDKGLLDGYKSCMENALLERPDVFITYALNDVSLLESVLIRQLSRINWICKDVLKIKKKFFMNILPTTQGALVNSIFTAYLRNFLSTSPRYQGVSPEWCQRLLTLAFSKLSLLDVNHKSYFKNLDFHTALFSKPWGGDHGFPDDSQLELLSTKFSKMYSYPVYSHASINYFLEHQSSTTGVFLALVSGGRTVNERFWQASRDFCADIDLSSCYGSALESFEYPVGLPEIFATSSNQKTLTLGEFLKRYESKLVPNLYKIVVSSPVGESGVGDLGFCQDLIFSKITCNNDIKRSFYAENKFSSSVNYDQPHLNAEFALLRREIVNGVITADVLEILRSVCTNQEYKSFMQLEVVSACYWDSEKKIEDVGDWVDRVLESSGEYFFDPVTKSVKDSRSRFWCALPLKDFIGELVSKRKEIKKRAQQTSDPRFREKLLAQQNALKLLINVLYGILASPYFSVGNTVLADNITARARYKVKDQLIK